MLENQQRRLLPLLTAPAQLSHSNTAGTGSNTENQRTSGNLIRGLVVFLLKQRHRVASVFALCQTQVHQQRQWIRKTCHWMFPPRYGPGVDARHRKGGQNLTPPL